MVETKCGKRGLLSFFFSLLGLRKTFHREKNLSQTKTHFPHHEHPRTMKAISLADDSHDNGDHETMMTR